MNLILASNSPRRRQLLALTGLGFQVVPAEVDETPLIGEHPADYVVRLASEKASWVGDQTRNDSLVVAADTTVADHAVILGKPSNESEAKQMLQRLRDRTHQVFSAIAIYKSNQLVTELCVTDVPMRAYSNDEINAYIASGDPLDKAGAYAIQNPDFHPVERLKGCYANVMGLPLCHLARAMWKFDIKLNVDIAVVCQKKIGYDCPVFQEILHPDDNVDQLWLND